MSDLDVARRFLDLAQQSRGPQALSEDGLRERFGEPTEVELETGQVWRARWDEVSVLVLLVELAGRDVLVAPVTIDPPAEDERAAVLEGSNTVFGVECTLWAGMTTTLPMRVLDRVMDAWPAEIVRWTSCAAQDHPEPVPAGARPGQPIRSELDPAAELRAELADELEALCQAPGLPVERPGATTQGLASLLGPTLDLAALCSALGLQQPDVMKLLRGKVPLEPEQIEAVSQATGLPAEEIASTVRPLPLRLAQTLEHPRWRAVWTQRAERLQVTEAQARLASGYGTFALAARETGGGEPDWDARLRQFLREQDDPGGDG